MVEEEIRVGPEQIGIVGAEPLRLLEMALGAPPVSHTFGGLAEQRLEPYSLAQRGILRLGLCEPEEIVTALGLTGEARQAAHATEGEEGPAQSREGLAGLPGGLVVGAHDENDGLHEPGLGIARILLQQSGQVLQGGVEFMSALADRGPQEQDLRGRVRKPPPRCQGGLGIAVVAGVRLALAELDVPAGHRHGQRQIGRRAGELVTQAYATRRSHPRVSWAAVPGPPRRSRE